MFKNNVTDAPVGPPQHVALEAIAENFSAVPSLKPAFPASNTAL
jgi:hypothetical protein